MRRRQPRTNPLLSVDQQDKDPYGFTLVGTMGRCPVPGEAARSPMKEKLYASAIEMKCPRHRAAVAVDGGYTNIWETRYPIAINNAGNIESEYGIRLVDANDKREDSSASTASPYGSMPAAQKQCLLSTPGSLHHHHVHTADPRIESTKLVKSHSCRRYEDQDVPVYYDGGVPLHINGGDGYNIDTGAHTVASPDETTAETNLSHD